MVLLVNQNDLHYHFHSIGAGVIEEVCIQPEKGFGFVRYSTHEEAALAIQLGNTNSIHHGKPIKCSWGSKPTSPGTVSSPLPPPVPPSMPSVMDLNLLGYDHQLALGKMGGVNALLHAQAQHSNHASMGCSGSQTAYDGGY